MSDPSESITGRLSDDFTTFGKFLWWLLPATLKGVAREVSMIAALCDAIGEELDEVKTTFTDILPELHAASATGDYLTRLALFHRRLARQDGELDEALRIRYFAELERKRTDGTVPGLPDKLAEAGFTCIVWELRVLDKDLLAPPANPAPADRDAYIVAGPTPTGAWTDHAGNLAMWIAEGESGAWAFLAPWDGLVVRVDDEEAPLGKFYRYNALTGAWAAHSGASQWGHFVIQITAWDGVEQRALDRMVRAVKPVQALPIIRPELEAGTWDDWELEAEALLLDGDGDILDDFSPAGD